MVGSFFPCQQREQRKLLSISAFFARVAVTSFALENSLQYRKSYFEVRQDEISHRLSADDLRNVAGKDILRHSSCYETYISKQNLRYYGVQSSSDVQAESKERRMVFDWSKCLFCKNATRKKDR